MRPRCVTIQIPWIACHCTQGRRRAVAGGVGQREKAPPSPLRAVAVDPKITCGSGPHPSSEGPILSRFQPSLSPSDESTPPPRRRRAGAGEGVAADARASSAAVMTHLRMMMGAVQVCPESRTA